MLLKRLEDPNEEMWKEAFALCESAFPKEERRDLDELLRVMKNSDYHFCVLLERDELCGIVLYWEIGELIYLEHLATMPEKRCSGLGSAALELLKQEQVIAHDIVAHVLGRESRPFGDVKGLTVTVQVAFTSVKVSVRAEDISLFYRLATAVERDHLR